MSTPRSPLQLLLENTETVTVTRGKHSLECECFLERISLFHPDYVALQEKAELLEKERQGLLARLSFAQDSNWQVQQIMAPVRDETQTEEEGAEPAYRLPTDAEMKERQAQLEKDYKALRKELKGWRDKKFALHCEKLAFVLAGWKMRGHEDAEAALPTSAKELQTQFKTAPDLVIGVLTKIEAQVFGPLATPPDSTL